jgi:hypothetical protein
VGGGTAQNRIISVSIGSDILGRTQAILNLAAPLNAGEYVLRIGEGVQIDGNGDGIGGDAFEQRFKVASIVPLGANFKVNTTSISQPPLTAGEPHQNVAVGANGDYVIVWNGRSAISDGWDIYAQRYRADGTALGEEVRVNSAASYEQYQASVAMDGAGNYVVTWYSSSNANNSSSYDVYLRRFAANGTALGGEGEVRVNT